MSGETMVRDRTAASGCLGRGSERGRARVWDRVTTPHAEAAMPLSTVVRCHPVRAPWRSCLRVGVCVVENVCLRGDELRSHTRSRSSHESASPPRQLPRVARPGSRRPRGRDQDHGPDTRAQRREGGTGRSNSKRTPRIAGTLSIIGESCHRARTARKRATPTRRGSRAL
jgi:hypothetical protein